MNLRMITNDEIVEHQNFVRNSYHRTQESFTIAGLRRLMGNSLIAMGQKIHGRCEARREALANLVPFTPARGA